MKFTLRDVFWLLLVIGVGLGWWLQSRHSARLATEVRYWKSTAPPIALVNTPLGEAVTLLMYKHQISIDVDWATLRKNGITSRTPITKNLVDGNLRNRLEWIFADFDQAVIVTPVSENKVRLTFEPRLTSDSK
ncbi:hypothetical protein ETAA8_10410 [Anatilimnocola aggregata]|uniref:Uncharacterized protein n=1 Tax=Anatilimnocola aggregata TaxID=2528021 RepID=A0A517Y6V7_9BACT|nr:hypothetical protein [Anatilimnocola aggregata]QDU25969.1 hypothetical protein ETAA8_10410 [Anatilimnocola aggregata]